MISIDNIISELSNTFSNVDVQMPTDRAETGTSFYSPRLKITFGNTSKP